MATWATLSEARQLWRDAPADDATLTLYLSAAQGAVIAYAPVLDAPLIVALYPSEGLTPSSALFPIYSPTATIPAAWQLAQIMQARNIFNSGKASPSDSFDGSSFGLTTMPLDWQIKQLIRPQRALGAIA